MLVENIVSTHVPSPPNMLKGIIKYLPCVELTEGEILILGYALKAVAE